MTGKMSKKAENAKRHNVARVDLKRTIAKTKSSGPACGPFDDIRNAPHGQVLGIQIAGSRPIPASYIDSDELK